MLRCDDVVQVMRKNSIQYTETVPIYVSLINDIARLEFKARSVCSKCVFKSYPYMRTQKKKVHPIEKYTTKNINLSFSYLKKKN
jgi:hypothetical protein